jgi:hypothetical protein
MQKHIRSRVLAIGRPLRVELQLEGEWLERLRRLLQDMGEGDATYPLHRYLEELLEADIVHRENHSRRSARYLERETIMRWFEQGRKAESAAQTAAAKR